jgi:hypothetical protein
MFGLAAADGAADRKASAPWRRQQAKKMATGTELRVIVSQSVRDLQGSRVYVASDAACPPTEFGKLCTYTGA